MENKECAKLLVELYSEYFDLTNRYGQPVKNEYAEAVAQAIMALSGRAEDGK